MRSFAAPLYVLILANVAIAAPANFNVNVDQPGGSNLENREVYHTTSVGTTTTAQLAVRRFENDNIPVTTATPTSSGSTIAYPTYVVRDEDDDCPPESTEVKPTYVKPTYVKPTSYKAKPASARESVFRHDDDYSHKSSSYTKPTSPPYSMSSPHPMSHYPPKPTSPGKYTHSSKPSRYEPKPTTVPSEQCIGCEMKHDEKESENYGKDSMKKTKEMKVDAECDEEVSMGS